MNPATPSLSEQRAGDVAWHEDLSLRAQGVVVAFSQRTGGASGPPFQSLNLGYHVGDDPGAVDQNRRRLLDALDLGAFARKLTIAEQVHGTRITTIGRDRAGHGARAANGLPPIADTDAMITTRAGVPLLLCFADCVPVVLVAPGPAVAVVHAGWRGALGRLPGTAVEALALTASCAREEIRAYVGPHICARHYEVGEEILSQFLNVFGTFARAESGGLDLGAVVRAALVDAGVPSCSIASLGTCTAEETDRYFSHRAERGLTGRHGAVACILQRS